jgi:cytidylate kinase
MTSAAPGRRVVALDGPSGSGKSTVARAVARSLGWRYVDTGATYRAATLAVLRAGLDEPADVAAHVRGLVERGALVLSTDPDAPAVVLDGEDVSAAVRSPEVTAAVSAVSAVPDVRTVLVALQRSLMGSEGAVAEGRDVASVIAPDAAVKVYLDADPAVRASRRAGDSDAGVVATGPDLVAAVAADLARRDALDSTTNALVAQDGAVHLDATELTAQQVVEAVLRLAVDAGLAGR